MELTEQDVQWARETLKSVDILSGCSADELERLVCGLDKQSYRENSTILFQGEISSRLCLVRSGKVSVTVRKGKEKARVAELGPNSFFGEISLLTPRAATATVRAEESSEIFFLPGEVVQAIIKTNPALNELLNRRITERLEQQKKTLEEKK